MLVVGRDGGVVRKVDTHGEVLVDLICAPGLTSHANLDVLSLLGRRRSGYGEDHEVHIPPGGKTDALVETTIRWEGDLRTRGVDSDQLAAAIQATEHAINMIALKQPPGGHRPTPAKSRSATPARRR